MATHQYDVTRPHLAAAYLILLGWGVGCGRKMTVEIVLDLHFLAGQNNSAPPDITGAHVIFTDNV